MEEDIYDFDAVEFIHETDQGYSVLVGQYFEGDYCTTLEQIDSMYKMTDLSSIEIPLSVKDMFQQEV